jgi:hypothetical protein
VARHRFYNLSAKSTQMMGQVKLMSQVKRRAGLGNGALWFCFIHIGFASYS